MDRTSAPGHLNHMFVAEDPATNRPPTELVPEDFNAHQEELMAIILAAQIAPNANNLAQVLEALRSDKLFNTPAQFEAGRRAATMEAVKRELGSLSGFVQLTVASQLDATTAGKLHVINTAGGAYSTTMPFLADVTDGTAYLLSNCSGLQMTIGARGGEQIIVSSAAPAPTIQLAPDDSVLMIKYGAYWVAVMLETGKWQTTVDVTANYAVGVTYYNTYKHPMKLLLETSNIGTAGGMGPTVSVAGARNYSNVVPGGSLASGNSSAGVEAEILPGESFVISLVSCSITRMTLIGKLI